MTAAVLAQVLRTDLETAFFKELTRVLAKPPEHFSKRNEEKIEMGLTGENDAPQENTDE